MTFDLQLEERYFFKGPLHLHQIMQYYLISISILASFNDPFSVLIPTRARVLPVIMVLTLLSVLNVPVSDLICCSVTLRQKTGTNQ